MCDFQEQEIETRLVKKLVNISNFSQYGNHGALMTFSKDTHMKIRFSLFGQSPGAFYSQLSRINECDSVGVTNIINALGVAQKEIFTTDHGMRPDAKQVAVLLTDGEGLHEAKKYDKIGKEFKEKNIKLFVIGVGNVQEELLLKLVESNTSFIKIDDWKYLTEEIINIVGEKIICEG